MSILSEINGEPLSNLTKFMGLPIVTFSEIIGMPVGTFLFATTTDKDAAYNVFEIVISTSLNVFAVNQGEVTDSVALPNAGLRPFTWDFSTHVGTTFLYFTSINLSDITLLNFSFDGTIDTLNTTGMTNLQTLLVRHNPNLTQLDLTTNVNLQRLQIALFSSNTGITSIDDIVGISNTQLTTFDGDQSSLTSLGALESLTTLTSIIARGNNLTTFDISLLINLEVLDVRDNNITSLDISTNIMLEELNVNSNNIASLNVSNNTALTELVVSNNPLTSLDISANTSLEILSVGGLTSFVGVLTINSNTLSSLSANGSFTNITGYNVATLDTVTFNGHPGAFDFDVSNATSLRLVTLSSANGITSITLPSSLPSLNIWRVNNNTNYHLLTVDYTVMVNVTDFRFQSCALSDAQVDDFFNTIEPVTLVTGIVNMTSQVGGGTATGASLTARNNMIANGWTINL